MIEAVRSMLEGIHEMSVTAFVVWSALFLSLMALLVRSGLRWRRVAKMMSTAVVAIGSAAEGIVAVEGTAEILGDSPYTARLTGAECVWYRTLVERREVNRKGSMSWSKRGGAQSYEPFLLRDSSGVCAVYADGDYITPTDRSVWFGTTLEPRDRKPPKISGSVPLSEIHAKQSGSEDSVRYTEDRIYPGDRVFVLGQFFNDPQGGPDVEEDADDGDAEQLGPHGWPGFNARRFNEAKRQAAAVTPLRVAEPKDKRYPLVMSGVPVVDAQRYYRMRAKGMFILSSVFVLAELFLVWVRFIR
jgi:hypothetical protein